MADRPQTIAYPAPDARPRPRRRPSRWRRTSSCCSAPPATWPGASCCPAWPTWRCRRWRPDVRVVGTVAGRHRHRRVPRARPRGGRRVRHRTRSTRRSGTTSRSRLPYVPQGAGPEAPGGGGRGGRGRARRPDVRRLHYLTRAAEGRAEAVIAMLRDADLVERSGSSWRSRSAPTWTARSSSTTSCTRSSTSRRSSGSTTSSARRRRRTSSRSASPTACSSRSGTATSSTTSRSTSPRRSAWTSGPSFYEATGAYKDMVVTHLFQVLAFVAMEPPTALEPRAISEEKNKVFRSMLPIDPRDVVRGQYSGYRDEDGRRPGLGHRDVHRAAGATSTTGAGPACRSTCAPARRWPRACGSSRSRSRRRRGACSRPDSGVGARGPGPPDLRPRRRRREVSLSFYGKRPGPGHAAGQAVACSSPRRRRTGPATSSRPTSG